MQRVFCLQVSSVGRLGVLACNQKPFEGRGALLFQAGASELNKEQGRRTVEHRAGSRRLLRTMTLEHTAGGCLKANMEIMSQNVRGKWLRFTTPLCMALLLGGPSAAAIKNMAVVIAAGSKLSDVPLADLVKLCKGIQKTWPDGKSFTLVIKNPESPDMRAAMQKLFGDTGGDIKAAIAKVNESHLTVRIVGSDEELLRLVESTPGAVGILDVYSINSSVKVLRVDGKLPFDVGYALKGN